MTYLYILFSVDAGSLLPNPELTSTLNVPPAASFANPQSMALQASLALWRYTGEKVTSQDTLCWRYRWKSHYNLVSLHGCAPIPIRPCCLVYQKNIKYAPKEFVKFSVTQSDPQSSTQHIIMHHIDWVTERAKTLQIQMWSEPSWTVVVHTEMSGCEDVRLRG